MADQVIKILDDLCQKFGIVIDWTGDNVVPYVEDFIKRYITYEIATSIAWMALPTIVLIISIILIASSKKKVNYDNIFSNAEEFFTSAECRFVFGAALLVVSIVFGTMIFVTQIGDIITCLTIPEKIIFEELKLLLQ